MKWTKWPSFSLFLFFLQRYWLWQRANTSKISFNLSPTTLKSEDVSWCIADISGVLPFFLNCYESIFSNTKKQANNKSVSLPVLFSFLVSFFKKFVIWSSWILKYHLNISMLPQKIYWSISMLHQLLALSCFCCTHQYPVLAY